MAFGHCFCTLWLIWKLSKTDLLFSFESRNKIVEVRPSGKIASGTTEVRVTSNSILAV